MSIYDYSKTDISNTTGIYSIGKYMYESSLEYNRLDEAILLSNFYKVSLDNKDPILENSLRSVNEGVIGNFFTMLKKFLTTLADTIKSIFTSIINAITGKTNDNKKILQTKITVDTNTLNIKSSQRLLQMPLNDYLLAKNYSGLTLDTDLNIYDYYINKIKDNLITMRDTVNMRSIDDDIDIDKMRDGRNRQYAKAMNKSRNRRNTTDYLMITQDEYKRKYIMKFLNIESVDTDDITLDGYYYNTIIESIRSTNNNDTLSTVRKAIEYVSSDKSYINVLQDIRRSINKNIDIMKSNISKWEKEFPDKNIEHGGKWINTDEDLYRSDISKRLQYLNAYVSGFDMAVQIMTNTGIRITKDAMKQSVAVIAKAKAYNINASKQENAILMYENALDACDEVDELFAF